MKRNGNKRPALSLAGKAERALREAVAEVIESHKRSGDPIVVWRRGKVTKVYPQQLAVRETPSKRYGKPTSALAD